MIRGKGMANEIKYPAIEPPVYRGNEVFKGIQSNETLCDFWSWAYSDILGNTERGALAEYIVACALGVQHDKRISWSSHDLEYRGFGIEVKASAYLQTWGQKKLSNISFDIAEKQGWNHITNEYDGLKMRHSDIYVFCVFKEIDSTKVNPIDVFQWRFHVVSTSRINELFGGQNRVSEHELIKKTGTTNIVFEEIRQETDCIIEKAEKT